MRQVIHLGGASGTSEKALLGEYKGLIYFYKKYKSETELFLLNVFLKIGVVLRIIILGIALGRKEKIKIYAKALATI